MPKIPSIPILTFDIDWAPDFVIDWVSNKLIANGVKSTWFVTHDSSAVERLRKHPELVELGIHPNCFENSSHGTTEDEVLGFVCDLVPNAISMRTHGLYQTSNFLYKASSKYGIKIDCSIYLPRTQNIEAHYARWANMNLLRVPHFWADGTEKFEKSPLWNLNHEAWTQPGMKVLDFHPIHIYLNSIDPAVYGSLLKVKRLSEWTEEFLEPYINRDEGPRTLFLEIIEYLKGKESLFIKDILYYS